MRLLVPLRPRPEPNYLFLHVSHRHFKFVNLLLLGFDLFLSVFVLQKQALEFHHDVFVDLGEHLRPQLLRLLLGLAFDLLDLLLLNTVFNHHPELKVLDLKQVFVLLGHLLVFDASAHHELCSKFRRHYQIVAGSLPAHSPIAGLVPDLHNELFA